MERIYNKLVRDTQREFEIWDKSGSGVLTEAPLIYKACRDGKIGSVHSYSEGCIYDTVFTYLCGKPDEKFVQEHLDLIYESRLVCMTPEWEEYIRGLPVKFILKREVMAPLSSESVKKLGTLPEGYSLSPFTREIFEEHPFDHGRNYKDYDDFVSNGAGAAVLFDGKVVSASSSFITLGDNVELDVFTDPGHRQKGLADHCVYEMLRQSASKKLTVHWDAQNVMSSEMAKSYGFTPVTEYAVYWLERG